MSGHRVVQATSGAQGVDQARQTHPDLILLDQTMPGMDGVATVQALPADPATRRIPVVAMTTADSEPPSPPPAFDDD